MYRRALNLLLLSRPTLPPNEVAYVRRDPHRITVCAFSTKEAIENLNIICANLYEFLDNGETEPNDVVRETIDSIFENGDLNEDASDEELMEAIDDLFHVAATINEYLVAE